MVVQGTAAQSREQRLENLAGPSGWERFSRNSIVAPMVIDIDYIKDSAGQRIGHRIHIIFVAHAPLSRLRDRRFMEQAFGQPDNQPSNEGFRFEALNIQDLKDASVQIQDEKSGGYAFFEANLLNRVKVRGVVRVETVERGETLAVAWCLDSRFDGNPKRSNSWSQLTVDDGGQVTEQPAIPYSGCGGYLNLTQLGSGSDIVLIESWTLLHEPSDWFQGSNLLRSKLPLTIQESVRSFRRKLASK